jgi:hypothetical protein
LVVAICAGTAAIAAGSIFVSLRLIHSYPRCAASAVLRSASLM